jgi:peptidoglycan hydrolase CwlO-like protein
MQKIAAALLVVGLVVGVFAGYGGGYFTMQPRIAELEGDVEDLNSSLSSTQSELSSTQSELTTTKADLSSSQQDLSQAQSTINSLNSQLSQMKLELSSTQSELSDTKSELSKTQSELSGKESELSQAETDLTKALSDLSDAKSELSSVKNSLYNLQQDFDKIKNRNVTVYGEYVGECMVEGVPAECISYLLVGIGWDPEEGWMGTGYYFVVVSEGAQEGNILVVSIISLFDISVYGNNLETDGFIFLSNDEDSIYTFISISATDEGMGLSNEEITLTFDETPPYTEVLIGSIDIMGLSPTT